VANLTDITGNAVEVARKTAKSPATQLKGPGGVAAAGAALIALPFAAESISKLAKGKASETKDKVSEKAKDVAGEVAKDKLKPSMPKGLGGLFGGGDDDSESDSDSDEAGTAHGSGRRMPIQQSVDVAAPIKEVYNLWTQFEEWPTFMHRVESVNQGDDATVSINTKVWGVKKEFEAKIVEQRPDERIEWEVEEGLSHSGVVTFHQLAPRLTRIEVTLDVKPDSLLEKAGRGMRFTKRAVRGDLHRFKAFAEIEENAKNGWRGTIKDGNVTRRSDRKPSVRSKSGSSRRRSNGSHSSSGSSKRRSRSR
jgi:uncharacterized membrane protein